MPIRTINSIELSSICDNKCQYCPATKQADFRKVGFMEWDIYRQAIAQVKRLCDQSTQKELNLFGVGEPLLHPHLVDMIKYARKHLPIRQILHLNTNGNKVTLDLAMALKRAGITSIDITGHNHKATAKTIRIFRQVGIEGQLSYDFVASPNNWAGQVDWFEPNYDAGPCPWIIRQQCFVMSDGSIANCCIDAFGGSVQGNVFDDLDQIHIRPFKLCDDCHHETEEKPRIILP